MVGQRTLNPLIQVRILAWEPSRFPILCQLVKAMVVADARPPVISHQRTFFA